MRTSLQTKLLALIALPILFLLISGATVSAQIGTMQERTRILGTDVLTAVDTIGQIQYSIAQYRGLQFKYVANSAPSAKQSVKAEMDTIESEMNNFFQRYEALTQTDADRSLFNTLKKRWLDFRSFNRNELLSENTENALALLDESIYTYNPLYQDSVKLKKVNDQYSAAARAELESAYSFSKIVLWSSVVLAVVLSGVVGLLLSRSIVRQTRTVTKAVVAISKGDLQQNIPVQTQDELGMLASAFNEMALQLRASLSAEVQAREREREIREEADARRLHLEQAVADYLQFASQVAQGNLEQRLDEDAPDSLGQLSRGLNQMVEALHGARVSAQQLQQAEEERRRELEEAVADFLDFAQQVSHGDLSRRLDTTRSGSLGQLSKGLNQMVSSLHVLTSQVLQANNNMTAAVEQILLATNQQGAGAVEHSTSINQVTTIIDEVKTIAQQTAQQAADIARENQELLVAVQHGRQVVDNTVVEMSQIKLRVQGIAQTILQLAEQSQAIGSIIQTVNDLADQSNLLALNAAIEAARAGEHGRSFSVVAQHVRELAERSKAATAQVQEILSEIQRGTNTAVMVTEEGSKGVDIGVQVAAQAGNLMQRIAGKIENGTQANQLMAEAAQQQTEGMAHVSQAMQTMQQTTSRTLSLTHQAERAVQDLNSLAQSLQKAIAVYRI